MMRNVCLSPAVIGLILVCASPARAEAVADSSHNVADVEAAAKAAPLNDDDLADFRGGQAITIANQTMTSIVSGANIGGNVSAGAVNLTENALSSFNGLGNIVINTGSQVSLQSGMNLIVNVNQ
ncbi:hypothetical protein [Novosphingobium sp. PY1]|uniref:hypothetical protein n=1 Tax=Novosphingobium sp. PY1 TaxID=1882221 RepID=UPI001A909270|nr:hypothetical protein [Novosphingobium sp. PY1]GFM28704.1 uncharacterized protein PY1_contig-05-98 [Novosphingobium sp. PY1]